LLESLSIADAPSLRYRPTELVRCRLYLNEHWGEVCCLLVCCQGRIQVPTLPLRNRVPLNQLRGLGDRCKLRQRGPGWNPGRKRIRCTVKCEKAAGGNRFEYSEVHVLQLSLIITGALPAIKPKATAVVIVARWPLENNLNV